MKNFDYVSLGRKTIEVTALVAAVVVAVTSYAFTAAQLWWEENGDEVKAKTAAACSYFVENLPTYQERLAAFANGVIKAAETAYDAGRFTARLLNQGVDLAYYAAAGF